MRKSSIPSDSEGVGLDQRMVERYLDKFDPVWDLMESKFRFARQMAVEFHDAPRGFYLSTDTMLGVVFRIPTYKYLDKTDPSAQTTIFLFESTSTTEDPIRSLIINSHVCIDGASRVGEDGVTMVGERSIYHLWPNGVVEAQRHSNNPIPSTVQSLGQTDTVLLRPDPEYHDRIRLYFDADMTTPLPITECVPYQHGISEFQHGDYIQSANDLAAIEYLLENINPQDQISPNP